MSDAGLLFLPWSRAGLAGALTPAADGGSSTARPPRAAAPVELVLSDDPSKPVAVQVQVYGPGDVTGLDARQIIRMEPAAGADRAEPNLLASIDFDRADLPWAFATGQPGARLLPWICLVVVPDGAYQLDLPDAAHPLPRLTCSTAELPDPAEAWAWAHVQVAMDDAAATPDDRAIGDALRGPPERTLSRLLSPRRLRKHTRYIACVVPVFRAGVRTGLGDPPREGEETQLALAWTPPAAGTEPEDAPAVVLPVYHHWHFTTGQAGDFEALAALLRPYAVGSGVGSAPMDVSRPGFGVPELPAGERVDFEGALRGPSTLPAFWPATEAAAPQTPRDRFEGALKPLLLPSATRLGPPLYGGHAAGIGVGSEMADLPRWLLQLNLDPRMRAAAALGTRIVQENQEELMASAWRQAGPIERANQLLRQGQLARVAAESMHRRRVAGEPGEEPVLPDDRLLQMTAALHGQIKVGDAALSLAAADAADTRPSVAAELRRNPAAASSVSVPFRRVARPSGPLVRRVADGDPQALAHSLDALSGDPDRAVPELKAVSGTVTMKELSGGTERLAVVDRARISTPRYAWETPGAQPPAENWTGQLGFLASLVAVAGGVRHRVGTIDGAYAMSGGMSFEGDAPAGRTGLLPSHQEQRVAGPAVAAARIDLDNAQTPHALVYAVAQPGYHHDAHDRSYSSVRVVRGFGGDPAAVQTTHIGGPALGYDAKRIDVAVGDLSGNGVPDVVLLWTTGPIPSGEQPDLVGTYYAVGWNLAKTGSLAGHVVSGPQPSTTYWTQPREIVIPGPNVYTGRTFDAYGAAVGRSGTLVILARMHDLPAGQDLALLTARPVSAPGGQVPGWAVHPLGFPAPAGTLEHASIAIADWSGSGQPDLLVAWTEMAQGERRAMYRIGWDLDADHVPTGWSGERRLPLDVSADPNLSVTVGDLDPGLVYRRAGMAGSFRAAAGAHQEHLARLRARVPPPAPETVRIPELAAAVRQAIDPNVAVADRVAARLNAPLPPAEAGVDPLRPLIAAPRFPQAMMTPLRERFPDHFLPGGATIPPNAVTLLRGNSRMIESFLVGLNQEMNAELRWRGFPGALDGTPFRRFWTAPADAPDDIPAVAGWAKTSDLGEHLQGGAQGDWLLLVVRGELFQRYPFTVVDAVPGTWTGGVRRPVAGAQPMLPGFTGTLGADARFFAFPLATDEALGKPDRPGGWFFRFAEHPTAPRFGLDEVPPKDAPYAVAPETWRGLNWAHVARTAADLAGPFHLPAAAPFGDVSRPEWEGGPQRGWAGDGAQMAHITLQLPVAVYVHAARLLPGAAGPLRVTAVEDPGTGTVEARPRVRFHGRRADGSAWTLDGAQVSAEIGSGLRFVVAAGETEVAVQVRTTTDGRRWLAAPHPQTGADLLQGLKQ